MYFREIIVIIVSTYFRLELIEPSAREEFIFWSSKLGRLETASELKKILTLSLSSRRLYKFQAKISGHAVYYRLVILIRCSRSLQTTFYYVTSSFRLKINKGLIFSWKVLNDNVDRNLAALLDNFKIQMII